MFALFRYLGCLLSFTFGMFIRWKTIAMCAPVLPALALLLSFCIPDSPTFLVSKNMNTEACSALQKLYGSQFEAKEQVNHLETCICSIEKNTGLKHWTHNCFVSVIIRIKILSGHFICNDEFHH